MQDKSKLNDDFNFVSPPNHFVKGVVAGVVVFALTNSIAAYITTIAIVHFSSCAYEAFFHSKVKSLITKRNGK